jgi:hypothetical protein
VEDFRLWSYEAVEGYLVAAHLAWAYIEQRFVKERGPQIKWVGMVSPEVIQRAKPTARKWSNFRQCPAELSERRRILVLRGDKPWGTKLDCRDSKASSAEYAHDLID